MRSRRLADPARALPEIPWLEPEYQPRQGPGCRVLAAGVVACAGPGAAARGGSVVAESRADQRGARDAALLAGEPLALEELEVGRLSLDE